jgi:hypothetical protein
VRPFELTNYTFSIIILLAWGLWTIYQRVQKPPDNNWPVIYWLALTYISMRWADDIWTPRIIMVGLGLCLLLRFEFMNESFVTIVRVCELVVFAFVMFCGIQLLFG